MSNSVRILERYMSLLFVAAIAFLIISYWAEQSGQRKIQARMLNSSFTKVQPQNGKVLFVPSRQRMPMQILNPSYSLLNKPTLLSVGSQFRMADQHFLLKYSVSQIETDGVTIDYETDGREPSLIRRSRGSIKLGWK